MTSKAKYIQRPEKHLEKKVFQGQITTTNSIDTDISVQDLEVKVNHIVSFKMMMRRETSDKVMFNKQNYLNEIESIIDIITHLKIKDQIMGNSSLSSKIKILI